MFPLGAPVVPGMAVPLRIFEPRYIELVQTLTATEPPGRFATVMIERGSEVGGDDQRSDVGCMLTIDRATELPDSAWALETLATHRVRVIEWLADDPYPRAVVVPWPDDDSDDPAATTIGPLVDAFESYITTLRSLGGPLVANISTGSESSAETCWRISGAMPLGELDRQKLLCQASLDLRVRMLSHMIDEHRSLLQMLVERRDDSSG